MNLPVKPKYDMLNYHSLFKLVFSIPIYNLLNGQVYVYCDYWIVLLMLFIKILINYSFTNILDLWQESYINFMRNLIKSHDLP
jgi:hypothetical protein